MTTDTPLRVASWPGKTTAHNPFLNIFLGGIEAAGAHVVSLPDIAALEREVAQAPDILLLHWAERVFAEAGSRWQALGNIRRLVRALGRTAPQTRVVWLVHNLEPHDMRRFQALVWPRYVRALARRADGFLTLAPGTVETVRAALPPLQGTPAAGLWHPAYEGALLSAAERHQARADLGVGPGDRLLGYCGQIRPYKGVLELLEAFLQTTDPTVRLVLAGRPQTNRPGAQAFLDRLQGKAAQDARVSLRLGDLDHTTFRATQGACDTIAAPFKQYLHSGSLVHALSAGCQILTPDTPFAASYQDLLGGDWVRLYSGALTPDMLAQPLPNSGSNSDLEPLSGTAVGIEACRFFRSLLPAKAQAA